MQYNNEKQLKNMLFQYGLSVSAFNKILDFGLILTSPFEMDVFTAMYEANASDMIERMKIYGS